jgi:hypothetical protein
MPEHIFATASLVLPMITNTLRIFVLLTLINFPVFSQVTDSTKVEEEDYSQYGSTDESVKFCTQKVRMLSPTKLISLGYEWQAPFDMEFTYKGDVGDQTFKKQNVKFMGGTRGQFNAPVISNNRFILNLGANYYESALSFKKEGANGFENPPLGSALSKGLRTVGLNVTAFKPLDEKHFLILSALGDFSGNFGWNTLDKQLPKPTYTFAALYGWKKSENMMWAIGATQTWRGGEKLYIPLFLMNKTFNDKWGLEILLPARAHLRYNFSPQSILLGGFEIEGNSYQISKNEFAFVNTKGGAIDQLELRRSELKFRLMYEQKITGFIWLSVQAGWRMNYKFNFSEGRTSDRGIFVYESKLGNPLYAGISLNLVSP